MYRKFLAIFTLSAFSLVFSVVLFNCITDPYNIWNLYRRAGFNQWTPKAETQDRLILPIRFLSVRPETLFMGNSQVAWGVEASEYTKLTGKTAYNMGMLGSSIYEVRRSLEHAIAVDENLEEVYVSVFFEQFAANDRHPIRQKSEALDANRLGRKFISLETFFKTTLSLDATKDALETVKVNREKKYDFDFYMPTGRWSDASIERFCKDNNWTFNRSIKLMARDGYYEDMALSELAMEEMQRIVECCQEKGIKLHVHTMPSHARYMENYVVAWDVYEEWMRRLVQITPITDFTDYNQFTMSDAPEDKANQYYWDSLHLKTTLSNKLLAELSGKAAMVLGTVLNTDNVEAHLSLLKEKRKAWETSHPESLEEARYYSGFFKEVPLALQHKRLITGKSVVRLNTDSGMEKLSATLHRQDRLDLTGNHLTPAGKVQVMYAVLENGNGEKYYTMAEPVPDASMAAFMHDKSYEASGFHIQEPLGKVENGNYSLYLVEVAEDGSAYRSDCIANVSVN